MSHLPHIPARFSHAVTKYKFMGLPFLPVKLLFIYDPQLESFYGSNQLENSMLKQQHKGKMFFTKKHEDQIITTA